jgi:hypothetical protein
VLSCELVECNELVFTELILQILYLIYEIALHSRGFKLDLPTNTDLENYIISFWWGNGMFLFCLKECMKTK